MSPSAEALNVSRETFEKLDLFADLLQKWNPHINLVAKSTIGSLWDRHIRDSLQVSRIVEKEVAHWVDLGSGGGFPGLVVAILAVEAGNLGSVTLVESDQRKATFLRTVLRETETPGSVISQRIEEVEPLKADVLSARALAKLTTLLEFSERHLNEGGQCLFQKGKNWKSEVQSARTSWHFSYDAIQSQTESEAVVLNIRELTRV